MRFKSALMEQIKFRLFLLTAYELQKGDVKKKVKWLSLVSMSIWQQAIKLPKVVGVLLLIYTEGNMLFAEFAKKNIIEVSGQFSGTYSSAPNSRVSTNSLVVNLQPSINYYFWDNWYFGATIQGTLAYTSLNGANYYGELSGLGGRAFALKEGLFAYGQFEFGSSMPYFRDDGSLQSRYYFIRPTLGIKFLIQNTIINTGFRYSLNQEKYSFDHDFVSRHTFQLILGIGFFF